MNRDFKGIWIPREIWMMEGLSCQEKCLWAEIHSLYDRERNGCFASEEYLCSFIGVGRSRLYEMLKNLKDFALLETVSFDGRIAYRRAIFPKTEESFEEWTAAVRHSGQQVSGKPDSSSPDSRTPSYIEKRLDTNTPPIPPHSGSDDPVPAKAGVVRDFPEEVIETAKAMKEAMAEAKPDSKAPVAQKLLTSIDLMIRVDKRDAGRIMRVFRWALSDEFWKDKFFKPDPAKYLREKFDQLEAKMTAKPASSSKADRRARDSNGNPIKDEILDNLF